MKKQTCTNCVMDTTDSLIQFDEEGICDHCNNFYINIEPSWPLYNSTFEELKRQAIKIKESKPKNSDYDCLIGISGGVDSSYMAYYAKDVLGLNPMMYHIDAGWNSDIAVSNINKVINKLGLDLYTEVINWEEMKDLQRSFFLSQVSHIDTPQDHAFMSGIYRFARENNFKYILNGGNISTECIREPLEWHYHASDLRQIKDIHKRFGKIKLATFPLVSIFVYKIFYRFFLNIKQIRPLDYIEFKKQDAINFLKKEFDWQPYKEKHYESRFTKFYEGYWMLEKFRYDIRKAHYSSLILTNQMSREEALQKLKEKPYSEEEIENEFRFIAEKLDFEVYELKELFKGKNKSFKDYKHSNNLIDLGVKLSTFLGLEKKLFR